MRIARLIFCDFVGLGRVCGWGNALRWLFAVLTHLPECRRQGNLQPADRVFGDGPIRVWRQGRSAWVAGPCIYTGIREVWVRDSYWTGGLSALPDGGTLLDLGSGSGLVTLLALTCSPNIRGVAVEAHADRCKTLSQLLQLNHAADKVKVINAFVGSDTEFGRTLRETENAHDVPAISESQLIERTGLSRIDLLKCDIEGSEFGLFGPGSRLLAMTRQLIMEAHPHAGDVDALVRDIRAQGFDIDLHQQGPTFIVIGRRTR